jgi:hypothetical protein
MNKESYFAFHADFCRRMEDITRRKNADYCGDNDDPFANFRLVEKLRIATTEQGFLTRMSDKLSRIASLIGKEAQVKDESIADTLHDLANYCALFAGYLTSKKSSPTPSSAVTPVVAEERYYEIVAKSRSGEIVVETCPDVEFAVNRLDRARQDWPTFQLSIREVQTRHEDEDGHQEAS